MSRLAGHWAEIRGTLRSIIRLRYLSSPLKGERKLLSIAGRRASIGSSDSRSKGLFEPIVVISPRK